MNVIQQLKITVTSDKAYILNSYPSDCFILVIFSCKTWKVNHPPVIFNNMLVHSSCQKHLGLYLDEKWNFSNQIKGALLG